MAAFHLKVLTVDGTKFDGEVDRCIVRTVTGDVGILPHHIRYVAVLGKGCLTVMQDGRRLEADVSGGFIDVSKEGTVVFAHTCEWKET